MMPRDELGSQEHCVSTYGLTSAFDVVENRKDQVVKKTPRMHAR